LLSVIVATRNEAENIARLVRSLDEVIPTVPMEIVFVDDSDDGTVEAIESARGRSRRSIEVIHRDRGDRAGGLGGAVLAGLKRARAPWACVMDADLQHPPELIAELLEQADSKHLDLVVASRYCDDGDARSLGWARAMASRSTTTAARLLFPRRLRRVTDPMSGFFLVRRNAIALDRLRPRGFKILLEILVRNPALRVAEVSFRFGERQAGKSKATIREGLRYLSLLVRLRFARFGVVGASGLVVNTIILAALTDVVGLFYVVSAVIATQGSTLWNFTFTELWVFGDRENRRRLRTRMAMFFLMNNAALAVRGPLLVLLTSGLGIHYVVSNILSLVTLTLVRFALADTWIWAKARPIKLKAGPYSYDIHGIVSVQSDIRLPELERFRIGELFPEPNIRVRLGGIRSRGDHAWERRSENGRPAGATVIRYREGLGRLGFAVAIRLGDQIEVSASPLLRWSPHVLYTNVVEPILRWTFPEHGYALVHAACLAAGEDAFLVTARTDTGKTTTSLRLLEGHPYSFISDDLTLVSPDGKVLTYPKPLTISRHTLKAVRTPLLSRRERIGLLIQSRLHSRSGRRFALTLSRTRLPAATINALVQMVVPPPKYHVERLVPGVEVAPEARLVGLVVIQRGGEGAGHLDESQALATLMCNSEDAYGFPPYPAIEGLLRGRNGGDLQHVERTIVARALSGRPAAVMRSETMDWWRRLPDVVSRWTKSAPSQGATPPTSPAHTGRRHGAVRRPGGIGTAPSPAALRRTRARAQVDRLQPWRRLGRRPAVPLAFILAIAAVVRVWQLGSAGFNSDEAVYAGQAASIADYGPLEPYFPTFRAHPLLFQTLLSFGFRLGFEELFARVISAAFGVATVYLVFLTGRALYGRRVGLVAALFIAVMPYHVLVTRQVLLDGPMVFFATLTLYLVIRFVKSQQRAWLVAAGAAMGLTFLSKETSIVLLGSLYAFFALSPAIRLRLRDLAASAAAMGVVTLAFPLATSLGGKAETGGDYLAWQIFRRANHDWLFYGSTVPESIGPIVLLAAVAALVLLRDRRSWRETLLVSWIVIPTAFFQIWPVKGFQYLLPVAPAVVILAAWLVVGGLGTSGAQRRRLGGPRLAAVATCLIAASLVVPTLQRVQPVNAGTFLAGAGGVPGGRETGQWIRRHAPEGARLMTIGPSMANIVRYYGRRKAYGLSVSPNPLHRNPAYEPLPNPDLLIRHNDLQYLVWDAFSAARSPFFSARIMRYVDRFHGRLVHQESTTVTTGDGHEAMKPLISVYEVRP
jgi:glycosyltransferase involved in cell wall biosynthesis